MQTPVSWPFGTRTSAMATDCNVSNTSPWAGWKTKARRRDCIYLDIYVFSSVSTLLSFCLPSLLAFGVHHQVILRASWERGCSINTACGAKCRPEKTPRKIHQRADGSSPSVKPDVLNCQSRAKLDLMPCSLHHPGFPASAILLVSKGICCWENELHLL